MTSFPKVMCVGLVCLAITSCTSVETPDSETDLGFDVPDEEHPTQLVLAAWNVEHLSEQLDKGCKPRTPDDIAALKAYAKQVDADIYALQEVASVAAVRQLFPAEKWQIVMSSRPNSKPYVCRESGARSTQQKVAYAVRKGIDIISVEQQPQFMLNDPGLRYGLAITVKTPAGNMDMLNLHLKSGCYIDDVKTSDEPACTELARQMPLVKTWIDKRIDSGRAYAVLGDFNHRLSAPYNRFTRILYNNIPRQDPSLYISSQFMIGCHPRYPAPIDHIVLGNLHTDPVDLQAYTPHYQNMREEDMLSDHCAVVVDVPFAPQ